MGLLFRGFKQLMVGICWLFFDLVILDFSKIHGGKTVFYENLNFPPKIEENYYLVILANFFYFWREI
jgi:hypothetical protein